MKKEFNFLTRKLAIITHDGQFQDYGLSYVRGNKTKSPEDNGEEYLTDLEVFRFDRERPETTYVDSLSLREISKDIWKFV